MGGSNITLGVIGDDVIRIDATIPSFPFTSVEAPLSITAGVLKADCYAKLETENLLLANQDKLAISNPPFTPIKPINNGASQALVAGPGITIVDDVQNSIKISTTSTL